MRRRILRHSLAGWTDPAAAFCALFGDSTDVFWLDSGTSGVSYLGAASRVVTDFDVPVLDFLRAELVRDRIEPDAANPGFALGWVGWLGYELRGQTMGAPLHHTSRYPDAALMFIDRAIAFYHDSARIELLALADMDGWRGEVETALARAVVRPPVAPEPSIATWRYTDEEYLAMIHVCQVAIAEGEAYQLCLTSEASIDVTPDPVDAYLALRSASPSHHGALLRIGGVALLSSSPERFLSVSPGGLIESRPIKGTRPRGASAAEDDELRGELLASDKERAENLMIVDLMRNDIARVSGIGSVSVTELQVVESYAQVHQLVSTVQGRLLGGRTGIDAVEACFPAGSMTGAPKYSATSILDRLEDRARGIFSGAFGYFGLDGAIDLAMVIRSMVIDARGTTVGAGGGITALSVPADELAEVRLKASALLAVLGVPTGGEQTPGASV